MLGKGTLVKLDLKGSTAIVKELEYLTNAKSTSAFNHNFQERVRKSLLKIGSDKGEMIRYEADSALLYFHTANDAHQFADIVHREMAVWSLGLKRNKIILRIGCATGTLDLKTHDGYLNAIAYRLEPAAAPGGILIDPQTYTELSDDLKSQYDHPEIIIDKNGERYESRRWLGAAFDLSKKEKLGSRYRILEEPQIPNSEKYDFESIVLNQYGEIINHYSCQAQRIVESLGKNEINLILIPGGEYDMGTSVRSQSPIHLVKIAPFLISQYPITKAQWQEVASWSTVNLSLKKQPVRKGSIDSPVVKISWNDAVEFCDRLSIKTGSIYRLPTESEWEYTCRATTNTDFSLGQTITSKYVNYDATITYRSEPRSVYRERPNTINEFTYPNRFGVFDMHGNVWEWCADHWHDNYHGAPMDNLSWESLGESRRVIRGGSWRNEPALCTSTYRQASNEESQSSNNIGFRIVRELSG
jgi:formylglycine-generating enzyme required for sulfatase activity